MAVPLVAIAALVWVARTDVLQRVSWPSPFYRWGAQAGLDLGTPPDTRDGINAYVAGRDLEAMRLFATATRRHPEDVTSYLYLARLYRELGDLDGASDVLDAAYKVAPDDGDVSREMGVHLLLRGRRSAREGSPADARRDYQAALPHLIAAARAEPDNRVTQGYLACATAWLGRPEAARAFLARAGEGPWQRCSGSRP